MERSEIMEGDGAMCGVGITKLARNTVRRRHRRKRKRSDKPKPVEEKVVVVGAGSKEEGMVQPLAGKEKKLGTLRLSQELMAYLRTREVMGFLAIEAPRPSPDAEHISRELFGRKLREQIAAEYNENREFDAYVLYQYRTKGYAEIQYVVADDE